MSARSCAWRRACQSIGASRARARARRHDSHGGATLWHESGRHEARRIGSTSARCARARSLRRCATPPLAAASQGLDARRAHHRDLRGEPQLRQPVRPVPRRQRHRQRDARAVHAGRSRRQAAAAPAAGVEGQGRRIPRSRSDLPNKPFRIDAPPINLPLSRRHARPHPRVLPQPGADRRRAQRPLRRGRPTPARSTMGYYDGSSLPMWKWAQEYTLADNFFMGAFGGSYLNHHWLICACTPVDRDAPREPARAARRHAAGSRRSPTSPPSVLQRRAAVLRRRRRRPTATRSTRRSRRTSRRACRRRRAAIRALTDPAQHTLPPQTQKTIGDTLSAKGITLGVVLGRVERGGEGRHAAARRDAQGHRQPRERRAVLRHAPPAVQLFRALRAGHAGSRGAPARTTTISSPASTSGDAAAGGRSTSRRARSTSIRATPTCCRATCTSRSCSTRIKASPLWSSTVVIVTYDENGGFWDHVPPPKGDRWGPGTRIPAIIVSPFAKTRLRRPHAVRHDVDHQAHHAALRARAAARRARQRGRPDQRARPRDMRRLTAAGRARARAFPRACGCSGSSAC